MNSPKSSFFLDLEIPVKNGSLCVRVGAFAWMLMTLEAWLELPSAVINTVPGLAFLGLNRYQCVCRRILSSMIMVIYFTVVDDFVDLPTF